MTPVSVPFTQQQLQLLAAKFQCEPDSDEFKAKVMEMFRLYAAQQLGRDCK